MFGWIALAKEKTAYHAEPGGGAGTLITGNARLLDGTRVATRQGWHPVETLCLGCEVLTFDHGLQPVEHAA
ncbi:MAG TPA: hypothetical protein DEA05_05275 [Rhodobacteraceae bacterium]|jgi:hypothetical protein|nr:hypothetical protein [Paracoccaceae bacterium]